MRPITKILLLLVVAFVIYLVYPRKTDIKAFVPAELATLEIQNWEAQKANKEFDQLKARYMIYTSQYGFSPLSAFGIARNQAAAIREIAAVRNNDASAESRALMALREKYTRIKGAAKLSFDADALAREEYAMLMAELDKAPSAQVTEPMSRILAGFYGGDPQDFAQVSQDIAAARAAVLGETPLADGSDPRALAAEAYDLLKQIADTPAGAPAEQ